MEFVQLVLENLLSETIVDLLGEEFIDSREMIFNAGFFCYLEYAYSFNLVYLPYLMQLFPRIFAILLDLVLGILRWKIFWSRTTTKLITRRIFLVVVLRIVLKIRLGYWLRSLFEILHISLTLKYGYRALIILNF